MATQPLKLSGGSNPAGFNRNGKKLLELSYGLQAIGGGSAPATPILQRIYDTGLGGYVYYSKITINTAPLPGETSPNHTGNLVVSTHEVL